MEKYKKTIAICIALFVLSLIVLPWLYTRSWLYDWGFGGLSFSETGQIGDTIGGIANPFIAFCAMCFAAFAYLIQKDTFQKQEEDRRVDKFEETLNIMLQSHIENTKKVGDFMTAYKQLSTIYEVINSFFYEAVSYVERTKGCKVNIDKQLFLIQEAYGLFMYGLDFHFPDKNSIEYSIAVEICKKLVSLLKNNLHETNVLLILQTKQNIVVNDIRNAISHRNEKWGMYYRQLFHIVKFIDEKCPSSDEKDENNFERKYEYIKQVRATLSDYAQIMLYYNSLSDFGKEWNNRTGDNPSINNMGYIAKYRLIKNIPYYVEYIGVNPGSFYSLEINYWHGCGKEFFESLAEWLNHSRDND